MKPAAKYGYKIGLAIALMAVVFFFLPGLERLHSLGPANTGHETLECQACHLSAPGTARQQVQANLRYSLGMRPASVDFQHQPITNATCVACHDRPNDNHPAHRFNEPRFAEARAEMQPQLCVSCHREHNGVRVTQDVTFCQQCHQDLKLKNDPLDVSHQDLIQDENWLSCTTCHDFHGNHVMKVATRIDQGFSPEEVAAYFEGAASPYSEQKHYQAKETRDD